MEGEFSGDGIMWGWWAGMDDGRGRCVGLSSLVGFWWLEMCNGSWYSGLRVQTQVIGSRE